MAEHLAGSQKAKGSSPFYSTWTLMCSGISASREERARLWQEGHLLLVLLPTFPP